MSSEIRNKVFLIAEKYIKEFKISNGQIVAKRCPFCDGGDNGDTNTFAIGLNNGAWHCLRGGCGKKGSFKDLCDTFGEDFEAGVYQKAIKETKKVYDKPDPSILKPITDEIISYFALRGISEETLIAWKIASDKNGNIVFPFYENNELTYVKYRKPKKHTKADGPKEWQESNTKSILFGIDNISFNKPLVITEGQIDAMSVYEAGYKNVVSMPCGCNNFDWVDNNWEILNKVNQFILLGDTDEPGLECVDVLKNRLGADKCMVPSEYPELIYQGKDFGRQCKDMNEVLISVGPDEIIKLIDTCEPAPIKGLLDLSSVTYVDPSSLPRIYTKVPGLDLAIAGLGEGELTVVTGKRGEGKSTLNGQLLLNAIQQGYKVCAYSGELSAVNFLNWVMLQATERRFISYKTDTKTGKNFAFVPENIQTRIKEWLNNKFFLFDNTYSGNEEDDLQKVILNTFEFAIRRYGVKLLLVDNMMCIAAGGDEEIKTQARFAKELKALAVKYKVHIILVSHPRKEKAGESLSNDSVAGSSVITNVADNVFTIEKPNIRILKCRATGTTDYIFCSYDKANRRIFQTSVGDRTIYDWDHEGINVPEVRAADLPEFGINSGDPNENYPC